MAWHRVAAVGLGSFVVLGSLMVPAVGNPQQLADTMGAVGIMGDMNKGAGQNIAGLKKKATTVADKASERTRMANQIMDDTSADAPGRAKALDEGAFMTEYNKDFASADKRMVGSRMKVDGFVVTSRSVGQYTYVYVVSKESSENATAFAFRYNDPNMKFEDKSRGQFEGVFAFTRRDDKTGKQILYFDASALGDDAGAPAKAPEAAPKPVEPELPLAGWRFQGAVQTPDGSTGVFTRDGKTLYAHEGDILDKDLRITKLSASEVQVSDGKKTQSAMSW